MTLPKNKRGFRNISIEGQNFNWRHAGVLDIRPALQKGNRLIVDFGWFDELLYVNDKENRPVDFEPKALTPAFVRQAVLFALSQGWDIQKKIGVLQLKYNNGRFEIKDP
jgi:hypothetical protein